MDGKRGLIKSNMPETDQNAGEQVTQHSRTSGMILGKKTYGKNRKEEEKEEEGKAVCCKILRTV